MNKTKSTLKELLPIIVGTILALSILTSCEDMSITPEDCNCGIITNDGTEWYNNELLTWVDIESECSGNVQRWYIPQQDWYTAYRGTRYCIYNSEGW